MSVATYGELSASAGPLTESKVKLAKSLSSKDLFLSHSHLDNDKVGHAMALLEKHGANVYVDLLDVGIRKDSDDVAVRVREAVATCRRLVVLVTQQTSESKWIPWEMGLADGIAGTRNVALFPLRASKEAPEFWSRQEYFGMYATIERVRLKGDEVHCWAVRDPASSNRYWRLSDWISQTSRSQPQST